MCPAPPTLKTFCHLNRVARQLSLRITEEKSFEGWPEYIKNLKTTLKQNAKSNCGKLKSVLLLMPASGEGGILTHKLPKLPNRFEHWDLESFKNPNTIIFRIWSVDTSFFIFFLFFAFNLLLDIKNKEMSCLLNWPFYTIKKKKHVVKGRAPIQFASISIPVIALEAWPVI